MSRKKARPKELFHGGLPGTRQLTSQRRSETSEGNRRCPGLSDRYSARPRARP